MNVRMGRSNTGAEALFEIIRLCEQALMELSPEDNGLEDVALTDKPRQFRRRRSTNIVRRLLLIPGGLSTTTRRVTGR